jgi:hypothetical protein
MGTTPMLLLGGITSFIVPLGWHSIEYITLVLDEATLLA